MPAKKPTGGSKEHQKAKAKRMSSRKAAGKKPTGPPPEVTTEAILEALEKTGGLVHSAALALGCSDVTIYRRAWSDPQVQAAIRQKRKRLVQESEQGLAAHVRDGNLKAIMFVLETLGKKKGYVKQKEHAHGQSPNLPPLQARNVVSLEELSQIPLELRKQLLEAIKKARGDNGEGGKPTEGEPCESSSPAPGPSTTRSS